MIYRVYCGADDPDAGSYGINSDGFVPECGAETDFDVFDMVELMHGKQRQCCRCATVFSPYDDLAHATRVGGVRKGEDDAG